MKTAKKVLIAAELAVFVFAGCEKNEEVGNNSIEGTYSGTLTTATKSAASKQDATGSATAEVVKTGNNQVQVHLYGNE